MTGVDEIVSAGASLASAEAVVILLHGRGSSAESILSLANEFDIPGIVYLAPQAPGGSWYPYSFLAPIEANEPFLSASLARVGLLVDDMIARGIDPKRIALAGFSQGGCLALEFVARNPRGFGVVAGFSAGLIGPPGTSRDYPGSLAGTRVLLGCSDVDRHIPVDRVRESTRVLRGLGADVDERIYPGMGHTINADEIEALRVLLSGLTQSASQ